MTIKDYKILSLCCGAGGLDEGIKQAGGCTTVAVDYDPKLPEYSKDCLETIKLNHPTTETIYSNILDIENSLGYFDIVVGGPPCQDFSSANVNRKFDLTLVECFFRIVEKVKAKYWFMENVPDIIQVFKKKNHLIDCVNYGTPQHRKRRFFTNIKLPNTTHGKYQHTTLLGENIEKWVSIKEALGLDGLLQDRKTTLGEEFRQRSTDVPSFTLLTYSRAWIVLESQQKLYTKNEIVEQNSRFKNYSTRNYFHELNKPARTIKTKDVGPYPEMMVTDNKYARKLTLKECAILQGFPEDYKFYGGKTSIRIQIGNAVPPQVPKAFFNQLN